jgi:hypothetical protein
MIRLFSKLDQTYSPPPPERNAASEYSLMPPPDEIYE